MSLTPETSDPRDALFDVSGMTNNLGQRTGRSAMTVIFFALIKIVFTLGSTAALARYVSPAEQGLFALAIPAIMIAAGLSEFGLSQAIVQRDVVTHRLATTLFWVNVGLGLCLGTLVAFLGKPAAAFYGKPEVAIIFVGLAPYVLFLVLTTPYVSILRRQMRIKLIETTNLMATVIASLIAIFAAVMGAGLWALAIQLVLNPFLTFLFLYIKVGWTPSLPRVSDLKDARSALVFGGTLTIARILGEMARNVQMVVIGQNFAQTQAGLYYRSRTFADMPGRRIGSPLSGAFIPALSRLNKDPDAFQAMYLRQLTRSNLIMLPIGLFLMICSDGIVRVLLGPDWSEAAPVLQWMGLIPMTAILYSSLNWVLISCGQTKQILWIEILNFTALVISAVISVKFGFLVLVISMVLVTAVVVIPATIVFAVRYTPLQGRVMIRTLFGEILMILTVLGLGLGLREMLEQPVLIECVLAGLMILALFALRIAVNPDLRHDIKKVLKRN